MLLVSSCVPVVTWLCSRVMRFQSRPVNWPLLTIESPVAQWLEHPTRSRRVVGSYPIWGSDFFRVLQTFNLSIIIIIIIIPFLILSIILKNQKNLYVGSFNYFSYTIQIGSNWYMDTGVRDLEVACFKANSTWINDIGSKDLSNRPIYVVLNTHNLMILQLKYMPTVMNLTRIASSDWKS